MSVASVTKWMTVIIGIMTGVFFASAYAQQTIAIKFSYQAPPDSPLGKAAKKFKVLAETVTQHNVRIETYPNGELYKADEEMEALQLGAVQMLLLSFDDIKSLGVRQFEVLNLPGLFDSYAALHSVTTGAIGDKLLKELEPKGIYGLAFWDEGFEIMSANRPLKKPQDFKGLKMSTGPSAISAAELRALGAEPVVMEGVARPEALRARTLDGAVGLPGQFREQKMYAVQRYVTLSNHRYVGHVVVMNKMFWDALAKDVRVALKNAMSDASVYASSVAQAENNSAISEIRRSGKVQTLYLTRHERSVLKRTWMGVHREFAERGAQSLIDEIYKEINFGSSMI